MRELEPPLIPGSLTGTSPDTDTQLGTVLPVGPGGVVTINRGFSNISQNISKIFIYECFPTTLMLRELFSAVDRDVVVVEPVVVSAVTLEV